MHVSTYGTYKDIHVHVHTYRYVCSYQRSPSVRIVHVLSTFLSFIFHAYHKAPAMVSAGAMILKQVKLQVIAFNSNMYTILHISSLDSYLTFVQQK
jgi:hypothetical protein